MKRLWTNLPCRNSTHTNLLCSVTGGINPWHYQFASWQYSTTWQWCRKKL